MAFRLVPILRTGRTSWAVRSPGEAAASKQRLEVGAAGSVQAMDEQVRPKGSSGPLRREHPAPGPRGRPVSSQVTDTRKDEQKRSGPCPQIPFWWERDR